MEDHCTATDKDNKKLPRTSVFAVISLLAGLSGSIFIFHMELQRYIAIPEIIALAAGYFSLREIKRSESLLTGKTLSFLGILFGCIFIVASILLPYIDSRSIARDRSLVIAALVAERDLSKSLESLADKKPVFFIINESYDKACISHEDPGSQETCERFYPQMEAKGSYSDLSSLIDLFMNEHNIWMGQRSPYNGSKDLYTNNPAFSDTRVLVTAMKKDIAIIVARDKKGKILYSAAVKMPHPKITKNEK